MGDEVNQGRCGECGDEWNLPRPRLHDEGGMYGTGTIGAHLKQGEMTNITVVVTASHKGYFQFKLCPKSTAIYHVPVQLPADVNCDYCVIQWHYKAGNSWGSCGDGTQGMGCGAQETFINCADVAIDKV